MLKNVKDLKELPNEQYKMIFPMIAEDICLGIEKIEKQQKKLIKELLNLGFSGAQINNAKSESKNIYLQNKKLELLKKEKL